tara:strand:+ start:257 stop:469 length:213 start_codon:yes stop_codon:yes gene_type:complete
MNANDTQSNQIKKERIKNWQKLNRNKYNKYMKNYMKTYRPKTTKGLKRELIPNVNDFEYDEDGKVILKFN